MNTMWLDEPPMYGCFSCKDQRREDVPGILNWRRTHLGDVQRLYDLTRMKTYDVFGNVDPASIFENSCLSLVQINAINEVVTNISLCNYPNIPSISPDSWVEWISRHYGMSGVSERNTLFIHMLLWDIRYNDEFLKRLLDAVFVSSIHTTHVILVMPPWVAPVGFMEEQMTRIVPTGQTDSYRIQALYISLRHMHCPRLKIRRVVEEDNDDIIPILDRESQRFKELYGEFYISEMMRYPDGLRQLIVAEVDGLATGVLCLNKIVDIEALNQHFELEPYHGLHKPHPSDKIYSENDRNVTSDILFPIDELQKKDRFKVKTMSNSSTFNGLTEETDEDWFYRGNVSRTLNSVSFPLDEEDRNETECSCSDDGDACIKVFSDAPCPSCQKTGSTSIIWTSASSEDSEVFGKEIGPQHTSLAQGKTSRTYVQPKRLKDAMKEKSTSISNLKFRSETSSDDTKSVESRTISRAIEMERLSVRRSIESVNVAQEALYKRVTAFALDARISQALSGSDKSNSRLIVRLPPDLSPSGPKKAPGLPSKVRLDMGTEDESLAEEEEINPTDVVIEIGPHKTIHKEINWLPVYHGEINAFTLELFSMKDDVDERLAHDYLEAVFECFPDEEYCVVLIPPFFPTFPLLQSFVRVPLRFNKDYPLVMYLTHRASVIGNFRTREANPSDVARAEELLTGVPKRSQVLKDLESALEKDSLYLAYVFLCEETLVGFAILCVEGEIDFIRSRYKIEDHISFDKVPIDSHGRIIHLTIMPIFANLHRYFFLELMRLSDKRALYYRLYHSDASALTRAEPLVTFLGEMIPVTPRRRLKYYLANYPDDQPADYVLKETAENFALYMMVPRIASIQKVDVNVRVIVVGASDCGLSVLETLAFGPNVSTINFTNLTLISRDGIPFENRPDDVEKNELPFKGRYCRDYRHLIGTRSWINVVHGTLTAINRKDKFVRISSMGVVFYDYLVLACGLQYQRPKFLEELRAEKKGHFNNYATPENCLTINTERDAANSLNYCQRVVTDNPACSVILYGKNIDCYSALAMLLKSDLRPDNITLVEPAVQACDTENASFLANDEVEEAVIKATKESGVNIVSGGDLVDWILEEDEDDVFIVSVIIEQGGELRELVCDVLFNFKKKTINTSTFLAICQCGLVFDGALVIDPEFQTNDPCIFAAGTMTKYSRKFYADEVAHKYYDLFEVGEKLGQKLRDIICSDNGAKANHQAPLSKLDMTLPVFKKPIVTSCRLPGDYYYLNIKRPGNLIWDDINDFVMITGSPNSSIGYFQLHLNQFDTVESITCLSRKEFEVENYICLYGKHQTLLNDLKIRFQNSMIPDLYSYFRESWAVALFLDRFDRLRAENKVILQSPTVVCGDTLINDCTKALVKSKWDAMKPEDQEMIEARYAGSAYQEELENNLIDFLQQSEDHLPMYCNPRFLRRFMDDVEKLEGDPLFPKPDICFQ